MGIQSDIADLAELNRLADWARACVWPAEVADARLGRSAREFMSAASPAAVQALIAEIERLRTAGGDAMTYKAGMENVAKQREQLKAENEALRNQEIYWQCASGIGLVRCVPDARYRKFSPSTRMRYSPVLMVDNEVLKDAERYRWLRNRLIGAYSDWDDSGKGMLGLAFKVPGERWIGCDESIDAAMRKGARS